MSDAGLQPAREALTWTPWQRDGQAVPGAFRMGLEPADVAAWLTPPSDAEARLTQRRQVLAQHAALARSLPDDARAAAQELRAWLRAQLATCAPRWLEQRATTVATADPLEDIGELLVDDVCLVSPAPDLVLRGGVVTAPAGWTLASRQGLPVLAIHDPVEDVSARIGDRMRGFLERLPAERPFQRGNWFFYGSDRRWHPETEALPDLAPGAGERPEAVAGLWLRSEQQTLLRLPDTGWILFAIRTHLLPLASLRQHPELARTLLEAMASLDPAEARVRRVHRVGTGVRRWLEQATPPIGASG